MSRTSVPIDDAHRPTSSGRDPIIESAFKGLRRETPSVDSRRMLLAALGLDHAGAALAQGDDSLVQPDALVQPNAAPAEPNHPTVSKTDFDVPLATWAATGLVLGTLVVLALHIIGYW